MSFTGLLEVIENNGDIFTDSLKNDIVIYSETINNTYNSILLGCGTDNSASTIKINNDLIEINGSSYKKVIYNELWPNGTNTFKISAGTLGIYTHSTSIIYVVDNAHTTSENGRYQLWSSAPAGTFFKTPVFNLLDKKISNYESFFIEVEIYAVLLSNLKTLELSIFDGTNLQSLYKISNVTYGWHKVKLCLDKFLNINNYFTLKYSDIQNNNEYIGIGNIKIYSINMNVNTKYTLQSSDYYKIQNITPIGTVIGYPSSMPPTTDWKLCNGQSLNRLTYSELFSIISTNYGSLNINEFNLPNLNGKYITSCSNSINGIFKIDPVTASSIGQNVVNININNFPNHSHSINTTNTTEASESTNHTHSLDLTTLQTSENSSSDTHTHSTKTFSTVAQAALTHSHVFQAGTVFGGGSHSHQLSTQISYDNTRHTHFGPDNLTQVEGGNQRQFVQTRGLTDSGLSQGNIVGTPTVGADTTHSHTFAASSTDANAIAVTHNHATIAATTNAYSYIQHKHNILSAPTSSFTPTSHIHSIPQTTTSNAGNIESLSSIPLQTVPKSIAINYMIKVL